MPEEEAEGWVKKLITVIVIFDLVVMGKLSHSATTRGSGARS